MDDSVSRYPWINHTPNLEFLNKLLIDSALFGPPFCARVGNILYHNEYFEALRRPDKSPLRAFLRSGFFQMQMRKETINDTIQSRLDEGTNSTRDFDKKYAWSQDPEIRRELDLIDGELAPEKGKTSYSGNFRPFFAKLSSIVHSDIDPSAQGMILPVFDLWAEKHERFGQEMTRSNFEHCAIELLKTGKIEDILTPMRLINAVNHFAYGLGMSDASATAEISIETAPLHSLSEMCSQERFIEPDEAKRIASKHEVDKLVGAVGLIQIPGNLLKEQEYWNKLAALVDTQNSEKEAELFRNKKQMLLLEIDAFMLSPDEYDKTRFIHACKEYDKILAAALGIKKTWFGSAKLELRFFASETRAKGPTGVVKNAVGLFGGSVVGDVAGTALNIGLGVADPYLKRGLRSLPRTWNQFSIRNKEAGGKIKLTKSDIEPFGGAIAAKTIDPVKMAAIRTELR